MGYHQFICRKVSAKGFAFDFGGVFTMLPRGTVASDVLEICAEGNGEWSAEGKVV